MFAYGQAISRTTYSQLFSALAPQYTITCSGGSNVLNGFTDTSQIPIGAVVESSCLSSSLGGVVTAKSSNSITLNITANVNIVTTATVFPYGNGDSINTFNLPDYRGYTLVGRCNMGGVGCTNLSSTFYNTDPNALGVAGGAQSLGLTLANLPPYTPSGSVTVNSTINNVLSGSITTTLISGGSGANFQGLISGSATNQTITSNGTLSGTPQGGTSQTFSLVQPSKTVNYIIKVTPDVSISGLFGVASLGGMQGTIACGTGLNCSSGTISAIPGSTTGIIGLNAGSGITLTGQCATNLTGSCTITATTAGNINSQPNNYTIQNTDCGKTVLASGGQFSIALPSTSGFTEGCTVYVKNADTSAGKLLSGFPTGLTSPNVLWPLQQLAVQVSLSTWRIFQNPGRWAIQNLNLFVSSAGNDGNDGLNSGTPFRTLNQCRAVAQSYIDTLSQGNGGITCNVPSGQTIQEFVQVFFPLVGGGTLIFQGNGGPFNWVPANGSYALQFGDLGVVGLTNVNFTTTGSTSPAGLVLGHNYGVADFNTGVSFHSDSPAVTTFLSCDFDSHFNINNGFSYSGTITSFIFQACQNSVWNFNNGLNTTTATSVNRLFWAQTSSTVTFQGNVTWGGVGLTTSVALVSGGAIVNNLGAGLPGGPPTPTTGGQYCTSQC